MKPKLKKINKKTEKVFKESDVAAILENMNDNILILAEGQETLRQEMHREINELREEMREEMREGFSLVMDHLKRIDDELVGIRKDLDETKDKKVDWKVYRILERRIERAEKQIEEFKALFKVKNI